MFKVLLGRSAALSKTSRRNAIAADWNRITPSAATTINIVNELPRNNYLRVHQSTFVQLNFEIAFKRNFINPQFQSSAEAEAQCCTNAQPPR
ncbi:MAG: hypothetical protein ACTS4T_01530 [Candidatus Hodgkinia cicadicola]